MNHYIILDKDNRPYGGKLFDYKRRYGDLIIDINQNRKEDLWLFDTINDSMLEFDKDKHRIFEAKIGTCTLPGGNGRDCDNITFIREVSPDEIESMHCADKDRFEVTFDSDGNWVSPKIHIGEAVVMINPRGVEKLNFSVSTPPPYMHVRNDIEIIPGDK